MVQDLIPSPSIYLHVCTLYTCTNTYMPRFSPYGFFGPFKCLVPTLGFTSVYSTFNMCVFARVHTRTPTYAPTPGPSMPSFVLWIVTGDHRVYLIVRVWVSNNGHESCCLLTLSLSDLNVPIGRARRLCRNITRWTFLIFENEWLGFLFLFLNSLRLKPRFKSHLTQTTEWARTVQFWLIDQIVCFCLTCSWEKYSLFVLEGESTQYLNSRGNPVPPLWNTISTRAGWNSIGGPHEFQYKVDWT